MLLQSCNYDHVRGIEGRSLWQYEWLKNCESEFESVFHTIMEQASENHPQQFEMCIRIDYNTIKMILNKIQKRIFIRENSYIWK